MRQATAAAVKRKFGRKQLLASKVVPHYPESVEREYERMARSYMAMLNKVLTERLPELRAILERGGLHSDAADRSDAADDEPASIRGSPDDIPVDIDEFFDSVLRDFTERQAAFDLYGRLEKLSKLTKKLTTAEWKRVVKRTLGINIMDDYYNGLKFQQKYDKWIADNVGLIKTIPQTALDRMREVVQIGSLNGTPTKSIAKQIQEAYSVEKNHALFIARDQAAKLNADITREQHEDSGVDSYVWRTMSDSRVRERHAELNGKRFKYIEPPVVDERTQRRANPGEDYQCRCVALSVFDIDTVVLPWEKGDEAQ
jgi:SPP1 gp7 family putative phage head morphogenesis protein